MATKRTVIGERGKKNICFENSARSRYRCAKVLCDDPLMTAAKRELWQAIRCVASVTTLEGQVTVCVCLFALGVVWVVESTGRRAEH